LLRNWLRNSFEVEDDEFKTPILIYNRKLDFLMLANCITRSPEEEESSPPHTKDVVRDSKKEMENTLPPFQGYVVINLEDMTLAPTPQFVVGSNKLNNSPMELGSTQYVRSKVHTKPPKNCSHKYNLSTITFFGNVWTSHLRLFLFVLSIFD